MFSLRNRRILSASQLVRGTVRSLFALLSMSDTQHPLGAAWYGRQRDGGISKFSIGTANTPLINGITAFVHTYGDWCLL